MKKFKVLHKRFDKPAIMVTLHNPPYENENILYKTGWKEKDVTIEEISMVNTIELQNCDSLIDSETISDD